MLVKPHTSLEPSDAARDVFHMLLGFRNVLVYAESERPLMLIEVTDIVAHAPHYVCPAVLFGITKPSMVVHTFLDCRRK
jgi:hypothetical protein